MSRLFSPMSPFRGLRKKASPRLTAYQGGKQIPLQQGMAAIAAGRPGLGGAYQGAFDEAKTANLKRYEEILGEFQTMYERVMAQQTGLGEQAKADVRQRYTNLASRGQADLVSRGLVGSTILPTMRTGYERETSADLRRVDEQLRREATGLDVSLTGQRLGFMERRTDAYPDYNQMIQLATMRGQSGGGRRTFGARYDPAFNVQLPQIPRRRRRSSGGSRRSRRPRAPAAATPKQARGPVGAGGTPSGQPMGFAWGNDPMLYYPPRTRYG